MASSARRKPHQPEDPAAPLWKLTDDLLADILIRLPKLADLGRASAACPAFRRVITGRSFLRRIRAVHKPLLLGTLSGCCGPDFLPAQPPHPSAAVARAFADAADFSCSFLPSPDRCRYRDFRDGRALVSRVPEGIFAPGDYDRRALVKEFIVCNVLHRRYSLLPAIPDHLTACLKRWDIMKFDAFLAPSEDEDGTSFGVICVAEYVQKVDTKLFVFSFSSDSGQWHAAVPEGWTASTLGRVNSYPLYQIQLSARDYAHGCFCWIMPWRNKLLFLDTRTMEFSTVDIPHLDPWRRKAIVEAEDGRFGMFVVGLDRESGTWKLSYYILRNDVQSANQWQLKEMIQLPLNYNPFNILGVEGGYLLLLGDPRDHYQASIPVQERPDMDCFSLNLKTFQIEPFCMTRYLIEDAPPYAAFPPSLCPPTI